jgi:aerobic C4-dicarboxylate transport protein
MATDVASTKLGGNGQPKRKRWYAQLWIQVLIGMIAGILLGIFSPRIGARMEPFGDAFIKAIRMLIGPIIFCTVVHGIARMVNVARVGRVALKASSTSRRSPRSR